jgi:hypothetical protein
MQVVPIGPWLTHEHWNFTRQHGGFQPFWSFEVQGGLQPYMKHVQKTLPFLPPWQVLRIAYSMQDKEVGHAAHHQLKWDEPISPSKPKVFVWKWGGTIEVVILWKKWWLNVDFWDILGVYTVYTIFSDKPKSFFAPQKTNENLFGNLWLLEGSVWWKY